MYERSVELRSHIQKMIGWPRHASVDELRERWAEEGVTIDI